MKYKEQHIAPTFLKYLELEGQRMAGRPLLERIDLTLQMVKDGIYPSNGRIACRMLRIQPKIGKPENKLWKEGLPLVLGRIQIRYPMETRQPEEALRSIGVPSTTGPFWIHHEEFEETPGKPARKVEAVRFADACIFGDHYSPDYDDLGYPEQFDASRFLHMFARYAEANRPDCQVWLTHEIHGFFRVSIEPSPIA